jgi:hypothetical protein
MLEVDTVRECAEPGIDPLSDRTCASDERLDPSTGPATDSDPTAAPKWVVSGDGVH